MAGGPLAGAASRLTAHRLDGAAYAADSDHGRTRGSRGARHPFRGAYAAGGEDQDPGADRPRRRPPSLRHPSEPQLPSAAPGDADRHRRGTVSGLQGALPSRSTCSSHRTVLTIRYQWRRQWAGRSCRLPRRNTTPNSHPDLKTPTVKIVHTSDWHIGRRWKGIQRLDELEVVLDHLAAFIEEHSIDL